MLFLFFIDLIHNIIYKSVLLDQKFHQWQYSKVVTWYRRRHVYCWSRDLSLRCSKFYIYEILYNFNRVLYQFLETGTSDKTFMGDDQELKWLAFSLSPFHFSFTVPLIFQNYKHWYIIHTWSDKVVKGTVGS